jgi:hypothetical protein
VPTESTRWLLYAELDRCDEVCFALKDEMIKSQATSLPGIVVQLEQLRQLSEDFELGPDDFDVILAGLNGLIACPNG